MQGPISKVEARTRRAGGGGPGANTTIVKPLKFCGATFWALFNLATIAAHASPPSVGPRLLEAWTGRLLSVATAGLPVLLWLECRAFKSGKANDYRLVVADVVWKGSLLNMWDVPTRK